MIHAVATIPGASPTADATGRPAVLRHADAAASCAEGCRSFTTWIVCDPPAAGLGPHADPSCSAGATAATVYGEPTGSGVSSRVAEHANVAPQTGRIAARAIVF